MLVTTKQKSKARSSREADMISDLQNMDVMIGQGHCETEDSESGYSVRRPESLSYDDLIELFCLQML